MSTAPWCGSTAHRSEIAESARITASARGTGPIRAGPSAPRRHVVERRERAGGQDAVQREQEARVVRRRRGSGSGRARRRRTPPRTPTASGGRPRPRRRARRGPTTSGRGADRRMVGEERPEPVERRVQEVGGEPHAAARPRQDADPAQRRAAGRKERAQTGRGHDRRDLSHWPPAGTATDSMVRFAAGARTGATRPRR